MFDSGTQIFVTALTIWREARGTGQEGMVAVAWVIKNRAAKAKTSFYAACTKRWAFSSINSADDPQLSNWPTEDTVIFNAALMVAKSVYDNDLADPTHGSTLYYDDSISFPASWDKSKVQATVKIGRLNFFKEL